jgi:hypothetical protein
MQCTVQLRGYDVVPYQCSTDGSGTAPDSIESHRERDEECEFLCHSTVELSQDICGNRCSPMSFIELRGKGVTETRTSPRTVRQPMEILSSCGFTARLSAPNGPEPCTSMPTSKATSSSGSWLSLRKAQAVEAQTNRPDEGL